MLIKVKKNLEFNYGNYINNYFYSCSHKLIPYQTTNGTSYDIVGMKGKLDNFVVKQEKGRYKFYEIELSHIIEFPKQLN